MYCTQIMSIYLSRISLTKWTVVWVLYKLLNINANIFKSRCKKLLKMFLLASTKIILRRMLFELIKMFQFSFWVFFKSIRLIFGITMKIKQTHNIQELQKHASIRPFIQVLKYYFSCDSSNQIQTKYIPPLWNLTNVTVSLSQCYCNVCNKKICKYGTGFWF